ncbi:MAG: hypothetical protein ACP5ME_15060 [Anaerolineae bacterium]
MSDVETVRERVAKVEASLAETQRRVGSLEEDMRRIDGKLDRISDQLNQLVGSYKEGVADQRASSHRSLALTGIVVGAIVGAIEIIVSIVIHIR